MTKTALVDGAIRIGALGVSGLLLAGCSSSGTISAAASGGTGSTTPASNQSSATGAPATSASDGGGGGGATSDPAPATSDSTAPGDTSGVVTGTKLKSVFPANSELPAGYKRDEQTALDSADTNRDSPGDPLMPGEKCVSLTNSGISLAEGDFPVSYAELQVDPPENSPESFMINIKASGYLPGDSVKEMKNLRDMMARCKTFTTHDVSNNAVGENVTITPVSGLGDEAVEVKIVAAKKGYFNLDMYVIRVGDVVVGADLNVGGAFPTTLKGIAAGMATKAKGLK